MASNVVIAGGGFAGAAAARELERLLPKQSARLILVNDVNFLLYTPFLPEAAAGTLEPRHVVTPGSTSRRRRRGTSRCWTQAMNRGVFIAPHVVLNVSHRSTRMAPTSVRIAAAVVTGVRRIRRSANAMNGSTM